MFNPYETSLGHSSVPEIPEVASRGLQLGGAENFLNQLETLAEDDHRSSPKNLGPIF